MSWIERHAIEPDRCIIAALLDDLLRAVVMESAQALQLTKPKRIDVASVRHDMVRDAGCSEPAFARAHATERLDLQLIARPFAPTFPVKVSPSAHAQSLAHQRGCEQRQVVQALVISTVVVVPDELLDALFELSWQVVVVQQGSRFFIER